ncbi:MAG: heme oxygenase [Bacteroidia bacterium]|jgi:heme oxygenase
MLHEQIKSATSIDHQNTEKHSYGQEIMSRTLTKEQYTQLLIANYRYIAAWEGQWASSGSFDLTPLQLELRSKKSLLETDLRSLNIDPVSIQLCTIESPKNKPEYLGRMYVVEGSTLGGAMIQKQLKLNPNLEGCTFNFYGGYGANLIPFWKAFLTELNTIVDEDQQQQSILWAKKCFNDMEDCFLHARSRTYQS